jgi:ribonucleoside-diphosphate reductase alpha chain
MIEWVLQPFRCTLQAGFSNFHYLRPIWAQTTQKDALLGIGMTGIGSGKFRI